MINSTIFGGEITGTVMSDLIPTAGNAAHPFKISSLKLGVVRCSHNRDHVHVPHDDLQQRMGEPVAGAVAVDRRHHEAGQQELPARPGSYQLHETEEADRGSGKRYDTT